MTNHSKKSKDSKKSIVCDDHEKHGKHHRHDKHSCKDRKVGDLEVCNYAKVGGYLDVDGVTNLKGELYVGDKAKFYKNVDVHGSVNVNKDSVAKPKGNLKADNTDAVLSTGGEANGYKEYSKQVKTPTKTYAKDDSAKTSTKQAYSKKASNNKENAEVGSGKSVNSNNKSVLKGKA